MAGRAEDKPSFIRGAYRLTRHQIARRFTVSVDTVTAWWLQGRIRGVDLNAGLKKKRDLRFADDDVERFEEELRRAAEIDELAKK